MFSPFNPFDASVLDKDITFQNTSVESVVNLDIHEFFLEGNIEMNAAEVLHSETVDSSSAAPVAIVDFSSLTFNSIKDFLHFGNLSSITEGVLNTFIYSDYALFIIIIVVALVLGLYKYRDEYKTNIYLLSIVCTVGYIILKTLTKVYYEQADDNFLILVLTVLAIILVGYLFVIQEHSHKETITFEYPILVLMAFLGLLITLENTEGLLIFLGLEIQAFTYYTMVSLKEKDVMSAEGALKYFLLGAIASGLFIFGIGMLYSEVAQTNFRLIVEIITDNKLFGVSLASLLIIISVLFKIGAAPFHLWVADAYQGSPFFVLLFLITFPKIVLYYLIFTLNNILDQNLVVLLAIGLSGLLGSIQANEQTKIKRFIAYTIIFNNSFFLALTVLSGKSAYYALLEGLVLYLIVILTTALSFFVLTNSETKQHLLTLRDLIAVKKSNIFIGLILLLGFFSAAGIPPFLGFFQKYLILLTVTEKLQIFIMIFLILSSILPAYYYIRITKIMYFLTEAKSVLLNDISKLQSTLLSILLVTSLAIFY